MKQELIAGIVIIVIGLSLLFMPIGKLWLSQKNGKPKAAASHPKAIPS